MKVLIDTNIVIDHVQDRSPFAAPAQRLLTLGYLGEIELWMSSSQVTDAFFLMSDGGRSSLVKEVKENLREIRKAVHVCSLGEAEIDAALESTWHDFEDACVYQCAVKLKADAIITRNKKDFTKSNIRVFDCSEYFTYLKEEKGFEYEEIPW